MRALHNVIMIAVLGSLLFTGCNSLSDGTDDTDNNSSQEQTTQVQITEELTTQEQTADPEVEMNNNYAETASIKIVDISDDMFAEKMQYDLTAEQVRGFIDSLDDMNELPRRAGGRGYYTLSLYDKNGELIDDIQVDLNKRFTDSKGVSYRSDKMKAWLGSVESSLDMSIASVLGRTPSQNYFSLMSEASSGSLKEEMKTNFDKVLDKKLSEDDVMGLADALRDAEISVSTSEISEKKYTVDVYDEYGASLYILYADSDLNVFTDYGYEVSGGNIKEWMEQSINDQQS